MMIQINICVQDRIEEVFSKPIATVQVYMS